MSLFDNRFKAYIGGSGAPVLAGLVGLFLACAPTAGRAEEAPSNAPAASDVFARVVPLTLTTTERKGGQLGPLDLIPKPFPLHLRLGAMLSPRTKFDGGIDATLGRGILPSMSTRIDLDAIVSANFHGISTLVPITLDQVYSKGLFGGNRLYFGAGVGPYIADRTRFGGKLFIGADLAVRIGVEGAVHFAGTGVPLLTLQARVGL
jgi:hypothetical protein